MSEDVCALCGEHDHDKAGDHLRTCYKVKQDTLDKSMYFPKLFYEELNTLQHGENVICNNRKKCRERQSKKRNMAKNQFRKPLYTPAPWSKEGSLDDLFVGRKREDGSWAHVAQVHTEGHNPPRHEEAEANAAIIVKAPDMLHLLKLYALRAQSNPEIAEDKLHKETVALITDINKQFNAIKEKMPY